MSNDCKVCNSPDRLAIDRAVVEGKNLAKIAQEYDVPYHSLYAHSQNHISRQLATVMEKKLVIESNELMETITRIITRAEHIFKRNYIAKKDLLALKALDSQRNTIQLLSNISAQLHAAKIAELQLKKDQSGIDIEEAKAKQAERLAFLTFEELHVYLRLTNKMIYNNNDQIISNNKVLKKVIKPD
jgi:transposase-like protein